MSCSERSSKPAENNIVYFVHTMRCQYEAANTRATFFKAPKKLLCKRGLFVKKERCFL